MTTKKKSNNDEGHLKMAKAIKKTKPKEIKENSKKLSQKGVEIRAAHWKHSKQMDSGKFEKVSSAILQVLSKKEGIRWGELSKRVEGMVSNFEGSVSWHAISAIRELETRGSVKREPGPPVLYYKL